MIAAFLISHRVVLVDTALVALVGVIAGSVVTGGVQAALDAHKRRLDSRTAARLLYMSLLEAKSAMASARKLKEWNPSSIDWDAFGVAWVEQREALARALGADDFMAVSLAYSHVAHLALIRSDHRDPPPPGVEKWNFESTALLIGRYDSAVSDALGVLHDAAYTWLKRRRRPLPPADDPV